MATRAARSRTAVRSQLAGVRSTRKLLRQLGPAAKTEMADILADEAPALLAAVKADAPYRTGALREGLASRLLRASLRLRVGIVTKAAARDLFYARILEFGRKADTASRGGPIAPRPFVFKKRPEIRGRLNNRLRTFWDRTLADAAEGIGFD